MYCMSINHKIANAEVRECYALNMTEKETFYRKMSEQREQGQVLGFLLLMTCNRNEIYFSGSEAGFDILERVFAEIKGIPVSEIRRYFMRYDEEGTLIHLFQVACGLDSAVLGEVEIIRQMKDAYQFAVEEHWLDKELHIALQSALNLAKEVAEKSLFTKLPVSVGTLTTSAVVQYTKEMEAVTVLLVGASGMMGSIVCKNLLDASEKITIIATTRERGNEMIQVFRNERVRFVPYENRYQYVEQANVIISATTSPHYTFLKDEVEKQLLDENRNHLFLDLAIPRDVDPDIHKLRGCEIRNIDYIKELARENNEKKVDEAKRIKQVIEGRVDELRKNLLFREYRIRNEKVKKILQDKTSARILYRLRDGLTFPELQHALAVITEE